MLLFSLKIHLEGDFPSSPKVQLLAFTDEGPGSISGLKTKIIPQAVQHSQKKNKKQKNQTVKVHFDLKLRAMTIRHLLLLILYLYVFK